MSQINLDTSPYFDDFDASKDFYKVLFKPGFPVQARELTTLQSILQNQISSFGEHFFKEGSMVIPGSITYNPKYDAVILNSQQGGIDVSLYLDKLIGTTIRGEISGVRGKVVNYLLPPDDGVTNPTIFVAYSDSGNDEESSTFETNEALINEQPVVYGNTTITSGSIFATTVSLNATTVGSAAKISSGVYFLRGTFVQVDESTVILEPYVNTPSYRVGLQIVESIVTAGQDDSLYDNAKGFNNFSAPGADRLKITATLTKKPINDFNDVNFVELLRVTDGEVKKFTEGSDYNIIKDYLAKRTYDESGDYVVNGLGVSLDESLNDGIGNGGVYTSNQKTDEGSTPDDDLAIVKVSSGKAYVQGYDVKNPGTVNLDCPKPRSVKNVPSTAIPFEMGSRFMVNRVSGTPSIGIDNDDNIVQLYDGRVSGGAATGEFIGEGRVYSFSLTDAPYTGPQTPWDLYLFDLQLFTKITLNNAPTEVLEAYKIVGRSSGASGYVRTINGSDLVLTQVTGQFSRGESISVNGTVSSPFTITAIEAYKPTDVSSFYQDASAADPSLSIDFTADALLYGRIPNRFSASDSYTITSGGTLTCGGRTFNDFRVGDIFAYQKPNSTLQTYNRVSAVAADELSVTLTAIDDVAGVCDGTLPLSDVRSAGALLEARILNQEKSGLFTEMSDSNISKVDLTSSQIIFVSQITGRSTDVNGSLTIITSDLGVPNTAFLAFDQERYSIHYSDGLSQTLDSNQVSVLGSSVIFNGLRTGQSGVTVNVTAVKTQIKSKAKIVIRSEEFIVDKISSGIGSGLYGLTQNDYYGLRVDDEEISLNVADVKEVFAVYESLDSGAPTLDILGFVNGLDLVNNVVKGEYVRGASSGAIGKVVKSTTQSTVDIVYVGQEVFEVGETVTFEESGIVTNLQLIRPGNYKNVTSSYTLDAGQRNQFYDYSRLVRNKGAAKATKKLLVIFDRFDVPANDTGDFYTVNSYDYDSFNNGMPLLGDRKVRASDTLDFRPRVAPFTLTTSSPFDYRTRLFGTVGSTVTLVAAPNESIGLGYDFYVGRKDRVIVDKEGNFKLIQGSPDKQPELPTAAEGAMELARITYPPYLYNVNDVKIQLIDNKRYTMKDIGQLEDRIENLEEITTLSLLERETESLQVLDAQGNDRFKTGFFADDFSSASLVDFENPDTRIDVNTSFGALIPFTEFATLPLRLSLQDGLDENIVDLGGDLPLVDSGTTKTGDLVTLRYDEVEWIKQPLASRVENVNPFNVILYDGNITLNPRSDDFVITRQIGNRRIDVFGSTTGSFNRTFVESIEVAQFMRQRNVGFSANAIRPHTRFYPFFEGASGIDIIPKLVEIRMRSGTFQVGETVRGFNGNTQIFSARVASQNHKSGNFNNPTRVFTTNPYNRETEIPTAYSASSTILNIDIASLADISDDRFFGLLGSNSRLVGSSSGAVADVTDLKLVSDTFGELFGSFFFRDPYASPAPAFRLRTGIRTFKLSSSPTNDTPVLGGTTISFAETVFESGGTVANRRTEQVTIRDLPPPPPPVIIDRTVTNNFTEVIDRTVTNFIDRTVTINNVERRVINRVQIREVPVRWQRDDPLAQTFRVDETGAYLTSVDIFMATKSLTDNLTVQIRPTTLATPENFLVQDFAEVVLSPNQVNVSSDGSVATNVVFPSPIYLQPDVTYAIVLLAPTTDDYTAWVARMGEANISGDDGGSGGTVIISQQYLNGSLFKSQNGSLWTPSQFEDLKFTLYKAAFDTGEATVFLNNPPILNQTQLSNNPIRTHAREIVVRVTPNTYNWIEGGAVATVSAGSSLTVNVKGDIIATGGEALTADITDPGTGFVDGSYTGVTVFPIDAIGESLTADIIVTSNEISSFTITDGGTGYRVGDTVGITTADIGSSGGDAVITIATTGQVDSLFLTNVSGEGMNPPEIIKTIDEFTGDLGDTGVTVSSGSRVLSPMSAGNVFTLNLPVHGMESDTNKISIFGILPDTKGTVITEDLNVSSNLVVVDEQEPFEKFEGITTTRGYAYIGGEIIEYTDNGDGTLGITSRGVDGTAVSIHNAGARIFPYEFSGVSLRRINTEHDLPIDSTLGNTRDINTLPIVIDRGGRTSGRDQLNFTSTQQGGGNAGTASQNFQFDRFLPTLATLTPGATTRITTTARTVSGTSAGGNEVSFLDQGFSPATINSFNTVETPRLVASRINELEYINDIPQNRSFTLALTFSSTDQNLSPALDISQANLVLSRSSVNNPISNYADDSRVNQIVDDPHSSVYISKKISLKNPSTSLRVILSAFRSESSDFRVLYRLYGPNTQGSTEPTWELFPGYSNLIDTDGDGFGDQIIDPSKNNGLPNAKVRASSRINGQPEILEYVYDQDGLSEFSAFQLKIVFSSTNEAQPSFITDIRAISLA